MPETTNPLGSELRWMRETAGFKGRQLAPHLGISQAHLSRMEAGKYAADVERVERWLDLCLSRARERLDDDTLTVREHRSASDAVARMSADSYRSLLLRLVDDAQTEVVSSYVIYRTGWVERQREIAARTARAARIRGFQLLIVPGPLQTLDYARRVFMLDADQADATTADVKAVAQTRVDRGEALRQATSTRYQAIIAESALDLSFIGEEHDLRSGVLANIIDAASHSHISVQIITQSTPWPCAPVGGFVMYDMRDPEEPPIVNVETFSAQITFNGARDLAHYEHRWTQLSAAALSPDESIRWLENQLGQTSQ